MDTGRVRAFAWRLLRASHLGDPVRLAADARWHRSSAFQSWQASISALYRHFVRPGEEVAEACLDHLDALGDYRFNVGPADVGVLDGPWVGRGEISKRLDEYRPPSDAGDVYAVIASGAAASAELERSEQWPLRTTPRSMDVPPGTPGPR